MAVRKKKRRSRVVLKKDKGFYFSHEDPDVTFISSGCAVLDCALGGGYATGRVINVVGDKSTGKTLLCIEACANFNRQFPEGDIHYIESESAFNTKYAASIGMPVDKTKFKEDIITVEDYFEFLDELTKGRNTKSNPSFVVLDSMDALSDRAELERDIDKGSFGAAKAKQLSELFRRLNAKAAKTNVTVFIVSQIRDRMNVSFGRKVSRSGGHAMDFYASQVLYLAEIGKIYKTKQGIKRPTGVNVRVKVDKNKVGMPFRECDFPMIFNYGVDDITANLNWLLSCKVKTQIETIKISTSRDITKVLRYANCLPREGKDKLRNDIANRVKKAWSDIEQDFLPEGGGKYS